MRFIALFLLSALVIAASAELNAQALTELFTGFTTGLNYPELNPSFDNCSINFNKTKKFAQDVVNASEQENPEAFATAVSSFGFSFANSIRSCGKSIRLVKTLFETIQDEVRNISQDSLASRFFSNLPAFNLKFAAFKYAFQTGNFRAAGENFAEIMKLFIFQGLEFPHKRQLNQIDDIVAKLGGDSKLAIDINSALLGIQGFIEEANTTIVVDHFTGLVNDTTFFAGQFTALQQAITSENFSAIVGIVQNIYKYIGVVASDYVQVKNEVSAFIQRDLPLFEDETKIAHAVESLFFDLPTTLTNIMRITTAYKQNDYREVGHGSGAIYNQLRNGAQ